MGIGRDMRRLCGELVAELSLPAPARPAELYAALCDAMSRRRGRPVRFRTAAFPPGTASGLWLDMTDQDLVLVEERTAPDHQLVILGHELWHMQAGHCGHHVDGVSVAARLIGDRADLADLRATVHRAAARTRFDVSEEEQAEAFGLLLASKCRTWLAGSSLRGPVRRNHLAGRIEASLGYLGRRGEGEAHDAPGEGDMSEDGGAPGTGEVPEAARDAGEAQDGREARNADGNERQDRNVCAAPGARDACAADPRQGEPA